jgi:hypothetical protein
MGTAVIKDKHLKLDQKKIDRAREILGAKTETEAIDKALDVVIQKGAKPQFKWSGALKKLSIKYTSVELQHEISDLRAKER